MNDTSPHFPPETDASSSLDRPGMLALIAIIALVLGAGSAMGILFPPGEWFSSLLKPTWNPPSWVFGPVWTALYAIMALALWLVLRETGAHPDARGRALGLFLVQFVLNLAWSPLFFGLHSPAMAFADICMLWIAALATSLAFGKVRALAGYLMVPYMLWLSFALVLNGTIWLMNTG